MKPLNAPMPYPGGKSTVASVVWSRFGNPPSYVEPFFGSGAVLLARESEPAFETVNDIEGLLVNFWRSVKYAPEEVAEHADCPVMEAQIHAEHLYLVEHKEDITERLMGDLDFFDAKAAGLWLHGICSWIGTGWCSGEGPWVSVDGKMVDSRQLLEEGGQGAGVERRLPHLNAGRGVKRQVPTLSHHRDSIHRKIPHLAGGKGINRGVGKDDRFEYIYGLMNDLSIRLRDVRVCCGDWKRILGPSCTTGNGLTGVFLDPPYLHDGRKIVYNDDKNIFGEVQKWAEEHGSDPLVRIALCGYDGGFEMPEGWEKFNWLSRGGFNNQGKDENLNRTKEVIWFSPNCIKPNQIQTSIFDFI